MIGFVNALAPRPDDSPLVNVHPLLTARFADTDPQAVDADDPESVNQTGVQLATQPGGEILCRGIVDREDDHLLRRGQLATLPVLDFGVAILPVTVSQGRMLTGNQPMFV